MKNTKILRMDSTVAKLTQISGGVNKISIYF